MELTNIGNIKSLFQKNGFSFTKSLGQNFLINPSIAPKIANLGGSRKGVSALEIGTGIGVLTKELALTADKVVAIEIDEKLKPILDETLSDFDNVEIIFEDVLKIDLPKLFSQHFQGEEVVVCANLPYYVTSPIIMLLLESKLPIKSLTIMVQKEAGDRICASLGTRESGAITVGVNYYATAKKLFNVSRGSFMPSPNVDSCVIRLDILDSPPHKVEDEKLFFQIVKFAFSQRRKQIINPLSAGLNINKALLSELMEEGNIPKTARAEQLKMEDFVSLYQVIKDFERRNN